MGPTTGQLQREHRDQLLRSGQAEVPRSAVRRILLGKLCFAIIIIIIVDQSKPWLDY